MPIPDSTLNCPAPGARRRRSPAGLTRVFLLWLTVALTAPGVQAQTDTGAESTASITGSLNQIDAELERSGPEVVLDEHISALAHYRSWAQSCIDREGKTLAKVHAQLDALGDAVATEPRDVSRQRNSLKQAKTAAETTLSTCRVILQRTAQLSADANALKTARLAAQLTARGPNVIALILDNWNHPAVWIEASKRFVVDNSGLENIAFTDFLLLALATALAVAGGAYLRRRLAERLQRLQEPDSSSGLFYRSLLFTLQRYIQLMLAALVAAAFFHFKVERAETLPFINIVAYGVPLVVLLLAFIDLFFRPTDSQRFFSSQVGDTATQLRRRLKILVVLIFVGYLLFATILAQSLPEPALLLTRAVYGVFMIINLIWIGWLIGRFQSSGKLLVFRLAISALFAITLSAELLGYRNLSAYLFQILIGTLAVLGLYKLSSDLLRDQLDSLDRDKGRWQHGVRNLLGLKPDQHVPGLVWLRVFVTLFLWGALAAGLMLIWQVPESTVENLIGYIRNGFTIGSFDIRPVSILQGILVLAVLLAINSLFTKWLEQEWLDRSRMERGARESVATISGYVGVAIAILVALGVTGMDFSKLAIIAGALSVGIGFGLQNIVNNFVSGLILLFERPIKTGDWIIVGTTEGYVRKISIRSTRIQTFDRSDVIVPNSELIANSVTNWMFQDISGRARVPVSVAYGSDTEKVKKLLLAVAGSHPEVITDGLLAPNPIVLFLAFGDSSLNFELRCHVRNIDRRLTIISDLNFEIDKAFRANGIEIPFPQRDLHIRDWSPPSPDKPGDGTDPSA